MPAVRDHADDETASRAPGSQRRGPSSALQAAPRKRLTAQDPLVHHGHHFGRVVHTFCNVQTLILNGLVTIGEGEDQEEMEHKEYSVFQELLWMVPGLEKCLMESSEEDVMQIADMIQKGSNCARADDTKGMKSAIIDWITPKGQSLNPHIPHNAKSGQGFNHERTGALLCPAGLDWNNNE